MSLLVASQDSEAEAFADCLRKLAPSIDIRLWPETGDKADIRYVLVWKPPKESLQGLPGLEVIFSIGAGVDHVLKHGDLPDVPLVRFVDPNLTMRMTEYVCLHVLMHHRRMLDYLDNQRAHQWKEFWPQPSAADVRVGVLGLGVLGLNAVQKLQSLGYDVAGWSRSAKSIDGIETYSGTDGLQALLNRTDILVCLLPHTPETHGMLNRDLLSKLAKDGPLPGPVLINAGRGKIQVGNDILAALDAEELWAASLDVFEEEPLPETSLLWDHPRVVVTPHNASVSDAQAVCRYVLSQIERYENGQPLENVVDLERGY